MHRRKYANFAALCGRKRKFASGVLPDPQYRRSVTATPSTTRGRWLFTAHVVVHYIIAFTARLQAQYALYSAVTMHASSVYTWHKWLEAFTVCPRIQIDWFIVEPGCHSSYSTSNDYHKPRRNPALLEPRMVWTGERAPHFNITTMTQVPKLEAHRGALLALIVEPE